MTFAAWACDGNVAIHTSDASRLRQLVFMVRSMPRPAFRLIVDLLEGWLLRPGNTPAEELASIQKTLLGRRINVITI